MTGESFVSTRTALARGETTCTGVVSQFLQAIDQHQYLNAFTFVDREGALQRAKKQDDELARGEAPPLAGLVLAVKDVLCMQGWPTSCASRMLSNFTSLFSATAVERLTRLGAIVIGRTNCDEFAMGSSNETSCYGPVRNPTADGYAPGGSSGGSAAAVAAGLCHVALGTDTGGSIRQPAALCGVVGLKPTYGRVSRYGLVAFASSFDCIGPMARTPHDAAIVLEAMAGNDVRDATSVSLPMESMDEHRLSHVKGIRVGVPREYMAEGLDSGIRARIDTALNRLREAGATVTPVSMPHTRYGVATYYILATAEASSNLGRYDGLRYGFRPNIEGAADLQEWYAQARSQGFGREVKRRIMLGTYVLSSGYYAAYYAKAQRVRTLIRRDFEQAFQSVDVLATPVTPMPGIRLGSMLEDPLQMYLSDIYTVTANLAGIPGLSIPIGNHDTGLPVGLQLLGPAFSEAQLLRLGDLIMRIMQG